MLNVFGVPIHLVTRYSDVKAVLPITGGSPTAQPRVS